MTAFERVLGSGPEAFQQAVLVPPGRFGGRPRRALGDECEKSI